MHRLNNILELIGYTNSKTVYNKSNLLHSIMTFAISNEDNELEIACVNEIEKIKIKLS